MRSVRCPHCENVNLVSDAEWGQNFRCEGPGCNRVFRPGGAHATRTPAPRSEHGVVAVPSRTEPRRPSLTVPSAPAQQPIHLTGPHYCRICGIALAVPFRIRRGTICHALRTSDPSRREPCRTDVYAAIYRCPGCLEWLDREVVCPCCGLSFLAPRDDVLHEMSGDAREGVPFGFACSSCGLPLQCDRTRQGQPLVGQRVVCFFCHHLIQVPSAGFLIGSGH
jgi:hypothetical protein